MLIKQKILYGTSLTLIFLFTSNYSVSSLHWKFDFLAFLFCLNKFISAEGERKISEKSGIL